MKKILCCILSAFVILPAMAQLTPEQRIQDSVIGWLDKHFNDQFFKPPTDAIQKKRLEQLNAITQWMKKSYTPVAGLGTYQKVVRLYDYSMRFYIWNVSFEKPWLDAKGHFRPISEENRQFYVGANMLTGTNPVTFINEQLGMRLFTWQVDGFLTYGDVDNRPAGIHPNCSKFITVRNDWQTVYLAPGNKLPVVQVTKGEFLQLADDALRKKLVTANDYDQKNFARIRNNIAQLKERYKNSLTEPAIIRSMQPSIYSFDTDIFDVAENERKYKRYYPVYKFPAELLEKCNSAEPLWIAVAFPFMTKESGNQHYEMYRAVSENLNYEYIYNYFFDPNKVKGIAYKPANEAELEARLNFYRNKNTAARNANANVSYGSPNIHFADDFSTATIGQDPPNWFYRKVSKHAQVTTIKDKPGKWLQLGFGSPISPTLVKKPMPENFTLDFDIATDGGYITRTGGSARLVLHSVPSRQNGNTPDDGEGVSINTWIYPGNEADYNNNNYRGNLKIVIRSASQTNVQNGLEGITYEYPLREFTNKKTSIRVAIKVSNGVVSVFLNNKPVAASTDFKLGYGGHCVQCGIPKGTRFNTIYWSNVTDIPDATKVYISNVKISSN